MTTNGELFADFALGLMDKKNNLSRRFAQALEGMNDHEQGRDSIPICAAEHDDGGGPEWLGGSDE